MNNQSDALFKRLKQYSLRIIALTEHLPATNTQRTIGHQLLRSGTSAGAHYAEARRAKSRADFISRLEGGLQELEETGYWLDLVIESGGAPANRLTELVKETDELIAILVASVRTAKNGAPAGKKPLINHRS